MSIYRRVVPHPLIAMVASVLLVVTMSGRAQAFTVLGPTWPGAFTTYVIDSSYSSQGAGWTNEANTAATDWNSVTSSPFSFGYSSSSGNHITAGNINNCARLAVTGWSWSGNTMTQFTTTVNSVCGIPFYDGTQAPSLPPNYYDLATVVRHELGHGLGLCHSGAQVLLMYYNGVTKGVVEFVDNDAQNGDGYLYSSTYQGPAPEGGCIS